MAFLRFPKAEPRRRRLLRRHREQSSAVPKPVARPAGRQPSSKGRSGGWPVSEGRVGSSTHFGAIFAVVFVATAFIVFKDNREATYGTIYVSTAAQCACCPSASPRRANGAHRQPEAFRQLQQSPMNSSRR